MVTTRPDATIAEVAKLLKAKRIGAVVVTDADGLVRHHLGARSGARTGRSRGRPVDLAGGRPDDLRGQHLLPDDGIDQLMQQMTEGRFRHLPVVEDGRMIGIISIGDVVKHRLQELEQEAHMLHDYISGGAEIAPVRPQSSGLLPAADARYR